MTTLTIPHNDFREALKQLTPFMSKKETRYYICGIFVQKIGEELILAATNGHILGERKLPLLGGQELEDFSFILSAKDVKNLHKILPSDKDAFINFTWNTELHKATFDTFHFQYTCKEVGGVYPDYRKVIPDVKNKLNLPAANSTYIAAAINAIGANQFIDIGFIDSHSAFIMNTSDVDSNFKCVIMPVISSLNMEQDNNKG